MGKHAHGEASVGWIVTKGRGGLLCRWALYVTETMWNEQAQSFCGGRATLDTDLGRKHKTSQVPTNGFLVKSAVMNTNTTYKVYILQHWVMCERKDCCASLRQNCQRVNITQSVEVRGNSEHKNHFTPPSFLSSFLPFDNSPFFFFEAIVMSLVHTGLFGPSMTADPVWWGWIVGVATLLCVCSPGT